MIFEKSGRRTGALKFVSKLEDLVVTHMSEPGIVREAEQALVELSNSKYPHAVRIEFGAVAPRLVRDLVAEVRRLEAERDQKDRSLARCYVFTGADPDGNDDRHLAKHAVGEVRRFRAEFDAIEAKLDKLREAVRPEHELIVSIEKRLRDIGTLADVPNANVTGAIHGVIDGYASLRTEVTALRSSLSTLQAEKDELKAICDAETDWRMALESNLSTLVAGVQQLEQEMEEMAAEDDDSGKPMEAATTSVWMGRLTALRIAATGGEK